MYSNARPSPRSLLVGLTLSLGLSLATGCSVDVDIDDNGDGSVEAVVDITGDCSGSGTLSFDDGSVSTWTKTLQGDEETGLCRIDVDWHGNLVDMADLRARAVEEQED